MPLSQGLRESTTRCFSNEVPAAGQFGLAHADFCLAPLVVPGKVGANSIRSPLWQMMDAFWSEAAAAQFFDCSALIVDF